MKRKRKTKEKTYVRMLAKFGWENKNKWKETNIEYGGVGEDKRARRRSWTKKNDGDRQRIEKHVDEESRAEQSKTKSTRWKKQMKARDRKGTGKQSWNQEKRDKTEKAKQKMNSTKIYIYIYDIMCIHGEGQI